MSSSLFSTLKDKEDLYLASSLCDGLEDNDIKQVTILLKNKKANPNVFMPLNGITPFHLVIGNDSEVFAEDATKLFLQYGGDPNVKSADAMTPVHIAAAWGRVKILELLLSNGGDPHALDSDNCSPFHYAFQEEHYEVVSILNKYCINKNNKGQQRKFNLKLDKIIINNGDILGEYLMQDKQLFDSSYNISSSFSNNCKHSKISLKGCISENDSADTILLSTDFITIRKYQRKRAIINRTKHMHISARKENNFDFSRKNAEDEKYSVNEINFQLLNSSNRSEVHTNDTELKNDKNHYLVKYNTKLSKRKQITKSFNRSKKCEHLKLYEKHTTNKQNHTLKVILQHNHLPYLKNYKHISNMNKWFDEPIISKSPNLAISSCLYDKKKTLKSSIYQKKSPKIQPKSSAAIMSNKIRCSTSNICNICNKYTPIHLLSSLNRYESNIYNSNKTNWNKKISKLIIPIKHKHDFSRKIATAKEPKNVNHLDCMFSEPTASTSLILKNNKNIQEIESKMTDLNKCMYTNNEDKYKENTLNIFDSEIFKKRNKYFFTFRNKLPKLFSRSQVRYGIEIIDSNITSKSNLRLNKEEKDVDLNQTIFYSFSHIESRTEKVIEKQNFQNFYNPKESSDSLQYLKNSPLLKSKNDFSEAKFDSYNKNKYIENKENINIKPLLSEANKISYRNKYSSRKHFDLGTSFSMETEYKYKDPEKDLVLLERSLCISPFEISSMNNSFYSCTTAKSELLKKNIYLLDNNTLRERLKNLGENPGPITNRTYHLYLKHLHKLETQQRNFMHLNSVSKAYIKYLNNMGREKKMLKFSRLSTEWIKKLDDFEAIEQKVFQEFVNPTPSHKWREGNSKNSFNYLLLDPRITNNFPQRASKLTLSKKWQIFLSAIFYVGKGKQSRPYAHLYDAFKLWVSHDQQNFINMKIQRILDIWNDGKGVIVLHIFQNTIPVEAYTREAAMIEMLGTQKLGNCKRGDYYGIVATWKKREKYELGKYLLFKALQILLVEGERQIFPDNL